MAPANRFEGKCVFSFKINSIQLVFSLLICLGMLVASRTSHGADPKCKPYLFLQRGVGWREAECAKEGLPPRFGRIMGSFSSCYENPPAFGFGGTKGIPLNSPDYIRANMLMKNYCEQASNMCTNVRMPSSIITYAPAQIQSGATYAGVFQESGLPVELLRKNCLAWGISPSPGDLNDYIAYMNGAPPAGPPFLYPEGSCSHPGPAHPTYKGPPGFYGRPLDVGLDITKPPAPRLLNVVSNICSEGIAPATIVVTQCSGHDGEGVGALFAAGGAWACARVPVLGVGAGAAAVKKAQVEDPGFQQTFTDMTDYIEEEANRPATGFWDGCKKLFNVWGAACAASGECCGGAF